MLASMIYFNVAVSRMLQFFIFKKTMTYNSVISDNEKIVKLA
jgi:hypothetical protein